MERDERRRADVLDRYWDARQRGDSPPRPAGVDEATARLVDHLSRRPALSDMPAARLRVRQRVVAAAMTMEETMHATTFQATDPIARPPVGRSGRFARRHHGRATRLALAATVLLALLASLLALDPDLRRPDRDDVIPAAVFQDATPSPSAETPSPESFVAVAMPGGAIAAGERTDVALGLYTVPSGTSSRPAGTAFNGCCPGLNAVYVLAGTATVRGDGPMQLRLDTGSIEPAIVTAGTDVVIEPGDTLLFEQNVATEWTVADNGSLSLLWGLVLGGAILDPPFGPSGWVLEDIQMKGPETFPVDPYAVRLWPATLPPGETLEPEAGAVQLVVSDPSEDARLAEPGRYAYTNRGGESVDLYVMTLSTTDPGAAAPSPMSTP